MTATPSVSKLQTSQTEGAALSAQEASVGAPSVASSTDTVHKFIVFSRPTVGNEDAYNKWYNEVHLAEVCEIPGFLAAQRFKLSDSQAAGYPTTSYQYLAIYEFDQPPAKPIESLLERVHSGQIKFPDSIDVPSVQPSAFSSISERVTAE